MIPTPDQVDLVLTHAPCFDGFTASWVAWLHRQDAAEYVQVCHGDQPPNVRGRHVAIFDFSYKRSVLEQLASEAESLIVVDHHESAAEDLAGLDYAIFDMARSGARLAYEWFFANIDDDGEICGYAPFVVRDLVDYVQDRDLWRFALPHSHAINCALKAVPYEFEAWTKFACRMVSERRTVIDQGEALLELNKQHLHELAGTAAITRLDGHFVWAASAPYIYASELGNYLCNPTAEDWRRMGIPVDSPSYPKIAAIWRYDHYKERMSWSLWNAADSPVNVAKIAVAHGGGGHFHSAGFEIETADPWKVLRPADIHKLPPGYGISSGWDAWGNCEEHVAEGPSRSWHCRTMEEAITRCWDMYQGKITR